MVLPRLDSNRVFFIGASCRLRKVQRRGQSPPGGRSRPAKVPPVFVFVGLGDFAVRNDVLGETEGRDKLRPLDNLPGEISQPGFGTVDLLSAFVKAGGHAMDLANRLRPEFGLKEGLLIGRVKVLTKADCLAFHDKEAPKHTSRCSNRFSKQMIGNCEIWSLRSPAKIGV